MLTFAHNSPVPFARSRPTMVVSLNSALRKFYSDNGILLRLSCPYTSQQNGKAKRILRTLNDGVHALLLHAAMPPLFWVEALQTSTFLLNRKPCKPRSMATPFSLLFNTEPDYASRRVFGCLCYPNTESTSPNKLSPRSVACFHWLFAGSSWLSMLQPDDAESPDITPRSLRRGCVSLPHRSRDVVTNNLRLRSMATGSL